MQVATQGDTGRHQGRWGRGGRDVHTGREPPLWFLGEGTGKGQDQG